MNAALTSELEKFVADKVASGIFCEGGHPKTAAITETHKQP